MRGGVRDASVPERPLPPHRLVGAGRSGAAPALRPSARLPEGDGASRKALVDAAVSLGVERRKAKEAFRLFQRYEEWKKEVWTEFQSAGRVATVLGNHYRRTGGGQLTGREQRSAVSQVVQGTASLIFKRALLAVAAMDDVRVVLPMHDALLFEHSLAETPKRVVGIFQDIMTDVLGARVTGKASISDFADREQAVFAPENSEL